MVAYATDPLTVMMTTGSSTHQPPLLESPKRVDKFTHSDANPAESVSNSTNGKERAVTDNVVEVVYYKHSTDRKSRVRQQVRICQSESTAPGPDWQIKSRRIRKILGLPKTLHQLALRIPYHVGRPSRTHQSCKTLHQPSKTGYSTGTFRLISGRPNNSSVREGRYR